MPTRLFLHRNIARDVWRDEVPGTSEVDEVTRQ